MPHRWATWTVVGLLFLSSTASAQEPSSDALIAELPFLDGYPKNRIFVDLAPQGARPMPLMLDTGAAASVVTPGYAKSLGVSVRRRKRDEYRRPTRLGRDLAFWVDTATGDTAARRFEHGLLGGPFLAEYVVELDFAARKVRLYDPKKFRVAKKTEAENQDSFKSELTSNRPFVQLPAADGSKKKVRLLLDTGAPPALVLSGAAAAKLGHTGLATLATGGIVISAGETNTRSVTLETFRLGRFEFPQLPALIADRGLHNVGGSDDSLLGYEFLSQFKVRIDYPRRQLWLERVGFGPVASGISEDPDPKYATMLAAGAQIAQRGGAFVVEYVVTRSAAERRGLHAGDRFFLNSGTPLVDQLDRIAGKITSGTALEVSRDLDGIEAGRRTAAVGAVA